MLEYGGLYSVGFVFCIRSAVQCPDLQRSQKCLRRGCESGRLTESPNGQRKFLLTIVSPLTAYEYRGFIITVWARPELAHGSTSVGIIYKRDQLGSIVQVQTMEGKLFEREEQAERHGVDLCKQWVDEQLRRKD